MFQLSLIDHIRLSFGSVATSYRAHARVAERLARRAWRARVVTITLLGLATGAGLLALTGVHYSQVAAAALTGLAFIAYGISISLDLEPRIFAHRTCAARLWALSERYRALLTEVHDGLIDLPAVTRRRDELMRDVQAVYEHALPTDREAYQIARDALGTGESGVSDQDIDRLLPASLRRTTKVGSDLETPDFSRRRGQTPST
jgi:SMODS and SLOG-associating 2TM effector domain family 4